MIRKPQAAMTGLLLATYLVGLPVPKADALGEAAIANQSANQSANQQRATVSGRISGSAIAQTTAPRLNGTAWTLTYWEGPDALNRLVPDTELSIEFAGSNVNGSAGCNRYSSPYQLTGSTLTISRPTTTTRIACNGRAANQETRYLTALQGVQGYRITSRGELQVTYRTNRGPGVMTFEQSSQRLSLNGTAWTLEAWQGIGAPRRLLSNVPVTAEFSNGSVTGSASCNRYRSSYEVTGANLVVDDVATTRMACAREVQRQEDAYIAALENAETYEINQDGKLEITYATDRGTGVLIYAPGQTGSRPDTERVIYVAPTTVDCYGTTRQQCLQIRDTPSDRWTVFYGSIEGFNYRAGYTYQLRVSERAVTNPPAGGPTTRLVLVEIVSRTAEDEPTEPEPEPTGNRTGVLTALDPDSAINIRRQPSSQAAVVTLGAVGDRVEILDERDAADGYLWYNVLLIDTDDEGWVREDLVSIDDSSNPDDVSNGAGGIQTLPASNGIDFRQVRYIRADPTSNAALERAILRELPNYRYGSSDPDSQAIRYFYNEIDLNGDRTPETIVYLVGSGTCGTGGCTTLIFQRNGANYRLLSRLTGVNNPIVVSDRRTRGWNDLIVYVSGGGARGSYRLVQYNGRAYPGNPSVEPAVPANAVVTGQAVIADRITAETDASVLRTRP
ncbi:MAG TPA: META domain-containing protein [Chroococcidiopsis sp.]